MNDFTKKELELLKHSLTHGTFYDHDELVEKLQSMIDNYCEDVNDQRFNMMPLPPFPER